MTSVQPFAFDGATADIPEGTRRLFKRIQHLWGTVPALPWVDVAMTPEGTWDQRITTAMAAAPTGGVILDARRLTGTQQLAGDVTINRNHVVLLCGDMACAMGTNRIVAAGGVSNVAIVGVGPWASTTGGTRFSMTGTGTAFDLGDSSANSVFWLLQDLTITGGGAGNGASLVRLNRMQVFDLIRLRLTMNLSATGTNALVLDGTGNYTGTGRLVNCVVASAKTLVYGTGTGSQGMNHVTIVGGSYNGDSTCTGLRIDAGDTVTLDAPDFEDLGVGVETSRTYLRGMARFEGNTTDIVYASGAGHNRIHSQGGSSSGLPIWTDANGPNSTNYVEVVHGVALSPGLAAGRQVVNEELVTLSTSGTTTDTSADLLPANAVIEAVTTRVTTALTTATSFQVGDATTPTRFLGSTSPVTAGSTAVGLRHFMGSVATDAAGSTQASAAKVRITCNVTPGAGAIRVTVFARVYSGAGA